MHLADTPDRLRKPPRPNRVFWIQVTAAVVLVASVVLQVSTLHGYESWFAVLALAVSVLATVLCTLCAVLTWRESHDDVDGP